MIPGVTSIRETCMSTPGFRQEEVRFLLDFDTVFDVEVSGELSALHEIWKEAPHRNGVRFDNFVSRIGSLPVEMQPYTCVVDVTAADPQNFFMRKHRNRSGFPDYNRRCLREIESIMNKNSILKEYTIAKERARPQYSEIHQWVGRKSRHYTRLILPLRDMQGQITTLVFSTRLIDDVVPLSNSLDFPIVLHR